MQKILIDIGNLGYTPLEYNLLEAYKGYNIVSSLDYPDCIQVHNPKNNTLFIVCMDDSKLCGHRTFNEEYNNVESARDYIDWLTEK